MTAAQAAMIQAGGLVERIRDVVATLSASVGSGDCLTAGYAVAELAGLADHVEELIFTARCGSGQLSRVGL